MAEISKFFNSTVTDEKWYQAQDFAEYFWMFLTSGLIHVDREPFINVEVVEDSLQLKVTPGPALIKGHLYRNTKDLYLTVDTPDVLEDRFDRLVLQLDLVPEDGKAGRIKALIKKGVASNDPVVPELTRNERIFELSLGYFRVRKNTASIAQLDYVDERLHEDYCGIVNSLITAPTQAMQQQFDLWFNSIKAGVEGDVNEWVEQQQKEFIEWSNGSKEGFDEWFEDIKGSLEGDVATNLTLRISKVEDNLTTHSADYTQFKNSTESNLLEIEKQLNNYNQYASSKDENGIFTVVEYKRNDSSLYMKSILSNADEEGNYRTMAWNFYDDTGVSSVDLVEWIISYDEEGSIVSKEIIL